MRNILTFLLVCFTFSGLFAQTECTVKILFSMNKSQPPSYTFITDPTIIGAKYYWSFGDKNNSDLSSPTHTFKVSDSYLVQVKVVTPDGKSCYGEVKARFEGASVVTPPVIMSGKGKVKMPGSNEGCRLLIYLENGTVLAPVEVVPAFEFKDGQYVELAYELQKEKPSGCNTGVSAKIYKIAEIVFSICKFDIVVKPKEGNRNTFLFYAVSQAEIKTWKWKFGDGHGSELKNPEHTYEKTGTFEVSCTITTAAGCTETRVIKQTVLPAPLATCKGAISLLLFDPTEKCNGKATVKLLDEKANVIENVKYLWSDGRTGSTVENLCPDKPYAVQAIIEGVCQKNTSFTMLSKPVWKVTNAGGKNMFSVISPIDGIQYEWDFGNGMVLKGAEVNYNFETDGVYNVTLKAISGGDYTEYSQQVEVLKSVTSIGNIKNPELEVYPNPVKDILKINFANPVEGAILIEIMNIAGQLAYSQQFTNDGFNQTAINVEHLKPGIYFLRVINGSLPFAGRKFIKTD